MVATDWIQGQPRWADLSTSNVDRSVDFYRQLFGWEAMRGGEQYDGYLTFRKDDLAVAGLAPMRPGAEGAHPAWTTYLHTTDAAATARAVTDAGGQNLLMPMEIPDMGVMGLAIDPTGATVGLWEGSGHGGFELRGAIGSPMWNELAARDFDAALPFYRSVFGWTTRALGDSADFRYELMVDGETDLAGLFDASRFLADGASSSWRVYFGVADTDRAVGRALELGGRVAGPPSDSPFGRVASILDPSGASFAISSVN